MFYIFELEGNLIDFFESGEFILLMFILVGELEVNVRLRMVFFRLLLFNFREELLVSFDLFEVLLMDLFIKRMMFLLLFYLLDILVCN